MKITSIETITVALPARRLHPMAFGGEHLGRYVLVLVRTDENITGLGEATTLVQWGGDWGRNYGESPVATVHFIQDILAPALVGADPFAIDSAHARMDRVLKGYPYAKAAVDMALHDIKGKALGVPVYELLGGRVRSEIPIAHSLGILDAGTLRQEAHDAVQEGVATIKVKVGLDVQRDIEAVASVRDVVGDDVEIVIDANQGYATPKTAIAAIRRMSEFRLRYAEQPVEGLDGMAAVAHAVETPIMADESAWTARDILEIHRLGAADVISLYTTKPGGLGLAMRAAAVADAAGFPCNVNGSGETGVGNAANLDLAAAARSVTETCMIPITTLAGREQTQLAGRMYVDDIITEPFVYRDGCLQVPSGPGLGVTLDEEKLQAYRVA